jgi:arsenate reductase
MRDRLPEMSEADALDLLSKNGNLVKRPFLLTAESGAVGFKEMEWREVLGKNVKRET